MTGGVRQGGGPGRPAWSGRRVHVDDRRCVVHAGPQDLWRVLEGVGGDNGWYSVPLAWTVRGLLDRLVGGVGLRRGRRDPARLRVGDAVDWWRVEQVVPGELLLLRAEMKVPGVAWLELAVEQAAGRTVLRQRAVFAPHGWTGHAYWLAVAPLHGLVFGRMLGGLAAAAREPAAPSAPGDASPKMEA